jgi:type IV secretion system protein TrbL
MIRRAHVTRFLNAHPLLRLATTASLALLAFGLLSIFTAHGAGAAQGGVLGGCPDNNGLNELPNVYCNAAIGWLDRAFTNATRFFTLLVGIEFAWTVILWALQKDNLGELVSALVIKTMGISFFYFILLNDGTRNFLPKIMQSFGLLGSAITGQPVDLNNPTGIFEIGTAICRLIFKDMPWANFYFDLGNISNSLYDDLFLTLAMAAAGISAVIISFVVFVAFLIAAGQLIMTLIEAYIMVGAGAVFLGFTGSRWTMSFGEKWFSYAFAIGVKLFVLTVIVGLGVTLFPTDCNGNDSIGICTALDSLHNTRFYHASDFYNLVPGMMVNYLIVGSTAIIFMMLTTKLPGLAASMLNGSPSLTMGSAMSTLSSVGGAVMGGFSAAASTGLGALKGAAGAATGVMDAGMNTANQLMDNAKEAAMMVGTMGAGGMGGEAAAAGGGGMSAMMGGGGEGGGGGGGMSSLMGGGGGGAKGGNSLSNLPGGSMLEKNSQMVVAKGFAQAGMAVAGGVKDVASAGVSGAYSAAAAAASPLMNMDEGGNGGSVSIGLKLPE